MTLVEWWQYIQDGCSASAHGHSLYLQVHSLSVYTVRYTEACTDASVHLTVLPLAVHGGTHALGVVVLMAVSYTHLTLPTIYSV